MKFNPIYTAQKLFNIKKNQPFEENPSEGNFADSTLVFSELESKNEVVSIPLPKTITEKYTIKRKIGRGAFGTVYLAEDKKIGRFVAIKQLSKQVSSKRADEIYQRFMQEARIGGQLDHPNIINVFALEEDKESACIIMEYLSGGSLASKIKEKAPLKEKEAVIIASQVLEGLKAAHSIMIIHRDIKPENILFDAKGEAKISDFGVAILPYEFGGLPDDIQTPSGSIIGTPLYMAPEQISKARVDNRADIYAFGAVMYEMLSGRKIFNISSGSSFADIKRMVLEENPKPIASDINPELNSLVLKMLEKSPDKRPQNVDEVLAKIAEIKKDLKIPSAEKNTSHVFSASSPVAMLEDVIRLFMIDGNISPAERRELTRRAERLGITESQSRIIEEKVRAELNLASLKDIELYQTKLEEYLSASEDLTLKSEQIIELEEFRKKAKIKEEEAAELLKQTIDKIEYKRYIEKNRFIF